MQTNILMFGYGNPAVVNLLPHFLSAFGKEALNYFFLLKKYPTCPHSDCFRIGLIHLHPGPLGICLFANRCVQWVRSKLKLWSEIGC